MKQVNVFEVWETNLMICCSEFEEPCKNVPEFLHQLHKAGKELKSPFGVSLKGDDKIYTYNGEILTRRGELVGAFELKSKAAKRNALFEFTLLNKDFCGCKIQKQALQIMFGVIKPVSVAWPK